MFVPPYGAGGDVHGKAVILKVRMRTRWAAIVGLLAWTTLAACWLWPGSDAVRTDDRNGDGRPDVWRTYDRQGRLVDVAIDSNFDGRSDVHEYYVRGELVRRESDRNFDDRIDLVEEFDATSHERVRSVVDSDFDGIADLLVLYQAGRPVFSKYAPSAARHEERRPHDRTVVFPRRSNAPLTQVADPFVGDLVLHSEPSAPDTFRPVWMTVGVVWCPARTASQIRPTAAVSYGDPHHPCQPDPRRRVSRGPPIA
jgi:hypothetical protein